MREIKFRAWDKLTDRMINWERIIRLKMFHVFTEKDWTPMQFTGLKDRNGKEIYEGDILELYGDNKEKHIVKIGIKTVHHPDVDVTICGVYLHTISNSKYFVPYFDEYRLVSFDNLFKEECEVIGNIYENPNLLKIN